jgi:uncharacterized protein YciI
VTGFQVVQHLPGPKWHAGLALREQEGVGAHIATMQAWLEQQVLVMGGPFLDDEGGGMAIVCFPTVQDAEASARADPATRAGLLTPRVRPWMPGMSSVQLDL